MKPPLLIRPLLPLPLVALVWHAGCATDTRSIGCTDDATGVGVTCPAQQPALGAACADEAQRCTYSPRPECGAILECLDGKWVGVHAISCGNAPAAGSCPARRPASYAVCDPTTQPPPCVYDNAVCRCGPRCSGAVPPPGEAYVYGCDAPMPAACPAQVPGDGAGCDRECLTCVYGSCGGASARCTDGAWDVLEYGPPP